jgi:hypothetical protein
MKKTARRWGWVVALAMLAGGAQARTDGEKAVVGIGELLRANDCAGAVKALNTGLQTGYPEVALLAGTMFEAGFCVTKNWDKAMGFYTQAHEGGIREGALRLAAGFADTANGPDAAAALWWAKRARLDAGACTSRLPDTDDPDRFVEALRAWPAQEVKFCSYVAGVMSFMTADARYPMSGIAREAMGRVEVAWTPGRHHFKTQGLSETTGPAQENMFAAVNRSISLAGARYKMPLGVSPTWQIVFDLVFDIDRKRWW